MQIPIGLLGVHFNPSFFHTWIFHIFKLFYFCRCMIDMVSMPHALLQDIESSLSSHAYLVVVPIAFCFGGVVKVMFTAQNNLFFPARWGQHRVKTGGAGVFLMAAFKWVENMFNVDDQSFLCFHFLILTKDKISAIFLAVNYNYRFAFLSFIFLFDAIFFIQWINVVFLAINQDSLDFTFVF